MFEFRRRPHLALENAEAILTRVSLVSCSVNSIVTISFARNHQQWLVQYKNRLYHASGHGFTPTVSRHPKGWKRLRRRPYTHFDKSGKMQSIPQCLWFVKYSNEVLGGGESWLFLGEDCCYVCWWAYIETVHHV